MGAHITQPPPAGLSSSTFWALHQQGLKAPQWKSSALSVAGRRILMETATCVWKGGIVLHSHKTAQRCSLSTLPKRDHGFFPYGLPCDRTTPFPQIRPPVPSRAPAAQGAKARPWSPFPRWRPPPPAPARETRPRGTAERSRRSGGGGEGARTHVSARRLSGSRCIPPSHWPPREPFTFYPAAAANRLPPLIAWGMRSVRIAQGGILGAGLRRGRWAAPVGTGGRGGGGAPFA